MNKNKTSAIACRGHFIYTLANVSIKLCVLFLLLEQNKESRCCAERCENADGGCDGAGVGDVVILLGPACVESEVVCGHLVGSCRSPTCEIIAVLGGFLLGDGDALALKNLVGLIDLAVYLVSNGVGLLNEGRNADDGDNAADDGNAGDDGGVMPAYLR